MTGADRPVLLLATGNAGKVREVQVLLPHVEVLSLKDRPLDMPEETGTTFEANAVLKAEHASRALGIPVLADDSGLSVDALAGSPGVRSARYAPGTDEDRYLALLAALEGVENRAARFECAMAFAVPGRETLRTHGRCEGKTAKSPRGTGGFGYDPVFELLDGRSMADLSREEKNTVSHRGDALRQMLSHLETYLRPS